MDGLLLEEFEVGTEYITGEREITEELIARYTELSGDSNPLHTNQEYAGRTSFGRPVAQGVLGRAVLSGLIVELGIFEGTALANLEMDKWRFTSPIYAGDRIHGRLHVTSTRRTSDGMRGVVEFSVEVRNDQGKTVQAGIQRTLVRAAAAQGQ